MRFFPLFFLLIVSALQGEIRKVYTLEPLEALIDQIETNDLVIFDFHNTLLTERDAIFYTCGKKCLLKRLHEEAPYATPEKVIDLLSIVLLEREMDVVDPQSFELIDRLQSRGIRTFVLTALRTGNFGRIESMERWRKKELEKHGYRFEDVFPDLTELNFEEFKNRVHPPVFLNGVFCSGSVPKGEALALFLMKIAWRPDRVILIDNAYSHHISVQDWMKDLNIPYLGFYYRAAVENPKPVDEKIVQFQLRYLIDHEKWLSDEEAYKALYE